MKSVDLATILAVFQEMLGWTLWPLLALAALVTLAFAYVLLRDRGLRPRRLVWSEAAGVLGGIAAVLVMQAVTSSGFADIGGPIDWIVVAGIFLAGLIGATMAAYAALGLGKALA
jgi:hypothetical protein